MRHVLVDECQEIPIVAVADESYQVLVMNPGQAPGLQHNTKNKNFVKRERPLLSGSSCSYVSH